MVDGQVPSEEGGTSSPGSSYSCEDVEQPMSVGSTSSSAAEQMPLEEALLIADAGGMHHRRVCLAVLVATLCGGMGGGVAPFLMGPVASSVGMGSWLKGLLASAIFVGMWIGSVLGGIASDVCGPGRTMVLALCLIIVGGLAPCGLSWAAAIVFARFVVGLGVVGCYQAGNTYVAESAPATVRGYYMALLHVTIAVGGLCSVALAVTLTPEQWRLLLLLNALPTVAGLALVAPFVVRHESPRWLLVSGRERECRALLQRLHAASSAASRRHGLAASTVQLPARIALHVEVSGDNKARGRRLGRRPSCRGDASPDSALELPGGAAAAAREAAAREAAARSVDGKREQRGQGREQREQAVAMRSWRGRMRQLCHGSLWRLHAVGSLVAFALNFGQKGIEIHGVAYMEHLGLHNISRSIYFSSMLGKIAGDVVVMRLRERVGSLRMLKVGFCWAALLVVSFVHVTSPPLLFLLSFGLGLSTDVLWCNIYIYLTEAFPTSVRSTAFGLAMGIGRGGGVLGAALGGVISDIQTAFLLYAASFCAGALLVTLFTFETSQRALADAVA